MCTLPYESRMMHIVLFHFYSRTPNPAYKNLAAALRQRGHKVWLAEPNSDGDLLWMDGDRLIAVHPGPESIVEKNYSLANNFPVPRWLNSLRFILRLRRYLRQIKPDIIHVNPSFYPWLLPLFMPSRTYFIFDVKQINVGVNRSWLSRFKEWQSIQKWRFCAKYIYDHACFHHANSAEKILGKNWPRYASVVPVGVSDEFLTVKPRNLEHDNKVRFLYVGAITRFRNLEKLFLAAQQLLPETNKFRIDFFGPDKARGYYHNLVPKLNLDEVVKIYSPLNYADVPELMASYDVGLAYVPDRPTWHFQPTLKALEYRAVGLPILSTDVTSHREIVKHDTNGLLISDAVESIVAGMRRFIDDPAFLRSARENAQAMRTGLTWEAVAKMYEQNVYPARVIGRQKLAEIR